VQASRLPLHAWRLSIPGELRRIACGLRLRAPTGAPPAIRRRSPGTRRPTPPRPSGAAGIPSAPDRRPTCHTRRTTRQARRGPPSPPRSGQVALAPPATRRGASAFPPSALAASFCGASHRPRTFSGTPSFRRPFLPCAPPGGRCRASVDREYADPAVTPPASRRSSLRAPCPPPFRCRRLRACPPIRCPVA
jgi:hypothetical protein